MEIEIDLVRCAGHGICEALRPDVFEVGDDAKVHLVREDFDESDRDGLQDAVNQCPEQALRLIG